MREAEERSDATTMPSSSSSSLSSFRGKEKKTDLDHRLERQARQRRRPRRGQTPQGLELGGSGRVAGLSLEVHAKFFSFAGVREKEKRESEEEKEKAKKKKGGKKKTLRLRESSLSLTTSFPSFNLFESPVSLFVCRLLPPLLLQISKVRLSTFAASRALFSTPRARLRRRIARGGGDRKQQKREREHRCRRSNELDSYKIGQGCAEAPF